MFPDTDPCGVYGQHQSKISSGGGKRNRAVQEIRCVIRGLLSSEVALNYTYNTLKKLPRLFLKKLKYTLETLHKSLFSATVLADTLLSKMPFKNLPDFVHLACADGNKDCNATKPVI